MLLSQERLHELLSYDKETGEFRRKFDIHANKKNSVAGYVNEEGYIKIGIDNKTYSAHRLAWLYVEGFNPKNLEIDHIDRNRSNNAWSNLRLTSRICNIRNSGIYKTNKTGIPGVFKKKYSEKWSVYIGVNKKRVGLGTFSDFAEAVRARWEAEVKYEFPECKTTSSAYLFLQNQKSKDKENVA